MWKVCFAVLDSVGEMGLDLAVLQHAKASAVRLKQRKEKTVRAKSSKRSDQFLFQSLV